MRTNKHGTALRVPLSGTDAAFGALIVGASGTGKSTLALTLIEQSDALLIADDQVIVSKTYNGSVWSDCPANIAGLLEVRGVGLVPYPYVGKPHPIDLVIELVRGGPDLVERLPEPTFAEVLGVRVPSLTLPTDIDALGLRVIAGLRLLAAGHWSKIASQSDPRTAPIGAD
ncbi:MAG: hypothetical protein KI792_02150 [Alphaproteobacteria bacterium]|nr:hypothetical protein [Alphaproteobacteria bacterium SS10]